MQKIWLLHQEIQICWEERCNDIQNRFYSFQTTISILFLTLLYTYFMPNITRPTYFLCLMKEQATQGVISVDSGWNSLNSPFPYGVSLEKELGQCSQYSDWLLSGWLRRQISSPSRVKNLLFSTSSRPALGSTQPPIHWLPAALSPGGKAAGAWSWPLTSS
jgi:hypothetical protein